MKAEDESISTDESLLRLIWVDYFKQDLAMSVQPAAFEPRKNEVDGISFFRTACLTDPTDALQVIAENKRDRYAIALLPVADLAGLALTVQSAKIAVVTGHVVVPELNFVTCKANRVLCKTLQKQLAEIASRMVVHRPAPRV